MKLNITTSLLGGPGNNKKPKNIFIIAPEIITMVSNVV
jgi:hypothetical protein